MIGKYRKKASYVEAVKWAEFNYEEIRDFVCSSPLHELGRMKDKLILHTLGEEGLMFSVLVNLNDWVVKDGEEMHSYSDREFYKRYERR